MELIQHSLSHIHLLCQKHFVEQLFLFGSYSNGEYNEESDVDFLVQFGPMVPSTYFDNYLEFKSALENVLNRKVDLVETQTIRNPILKESIDQNKRLIYGEKHRKMVN